jgi:hypothetical protein
MEERTYLDVVQKEFKRLKALADASLSQLGEPELHVAAPDEGNSVAVLMKHMSGNMLSRWRDFLTTDGEKPDRNRDTEFVITDADDRQTLHSRWEKGWKCLFDALGSLRDSDLSTTVHIRGEPHTVLQAINRQLTHYAYHTGQIVFLAKSLRGSRWQTLSIAKGQSQAFNLKPRRYLDEGI